ncbi:MAG: Na+/H+ antiporter [Chloroflexota bacterium]
MYEIELFLSLLVAVAILATVARALRVPYPILLVLAGLALALVPGTPTVNLAPDVVFLVFLPPLIYLAGFDSSLHDVRHHLRSLLSLAFGLVVATTIVIAVVAHALIPALGWPLAFALGAIVSPPDALAATALLRKLGVPRQLMTLLECEGLFNDATALVAYQAALAAVATDHFSYHELGTHFLLTGAGGVLIGLLVGGAMSWLRRHLDDPPVEISVSLLTAWAAYIAADWLGLSGVLSTVTAGLCVGWFAPQIMHSETRLRSRAVWEMMAFILTSLLFILIGLQLTQIVGAFDRDELPTLIMQGLLLAAVAIGIRLVWVFGDTFVTAWIHRVRGEKGERPRVRDALVVGWSGMRGAISLATALALPVSDQRDTLIFLTFCVILVTLVGQGLTVPLLVRLLGVATGSTDPREELEARSAATEAAVRQIDALEKQWPGHGELINALRTQYGHRADHLEGTTDAAQDGKLSKEVEEEIIEHRKIRRSVIDAERDVVLAMRNRGDLHDEAWRRIERDLDLEELRSEA